MRPTVWTVRRRNVMHRFVWVAYEPSTDGPPWCGHVCESWRAAFDFAQNGGAP